MSVAAGTSEFGFRRLLGYLWPDATDAPPMGGGVRVWKGAFPLEARIPYAARAKLRVLGALTLLLLAKLFVVRIPFIFKRCIDSISAPGTDLLVPAAWMVSYGFSRAAYTLLQEGRYLLFTPVGQNALRRFVRDSFDHVQSLDVSSGPCKS